MNYEQYQIAEHEYTYFRTACGLVGFIVFFLGSFFAFMVADETGNYYTIAISSGCVMLVLTSLCFFYVMHESKRFYDQKGPSEGLELTPLFREPEPESQQQPHWGDKTRHDLKYIRCVLGLPAGDSDETVDSEDDPDTDIGTLLRMAKSGLLPEGRESKPGTGENPQEHSRSSVGDVELHPTEEAPSNVSEKSSKVVASQSDVSPLKGLLTHSLSDSVKDDSGSLENNQTYVSAAVKELSLVEFEKQAAELVKQGLPSTNSEIKSEKQDVKASEDSNDIEPSKGE